MNTVVHHSSSQQISDPLTRTGVLDQTRLACMLGEREDLSKPQLVNEMNQMISCGMTQNLRLLATNTEDLDKIDTDQTKVPETMSRDCNTNDSIIIYSASDARAWHPLGPERIALFESWTTFSWELPLDRPGFTAALMPIRFTPWISGTQDRAFISYDRPENTISPQYSLVKVKKSKNLKQCCADDGELHGKINASDSFAEIAFQELCEAERASYDMTPELPSDAILMYGIHPSPMA